MLNLIKLCKNNCSFKLLPISSYIIRGRRLLHGECLVNRSLVRVSGNETKNFLQSLITNDINKLQVESSLYTMFLNVQGRVLFDCILLKENEENFIIDCDNQIVEPLINHLKLYKVRRKLAFEKSNSIVWVVYDPKFNYMTPESLGDDMILDISDDALKSKLSISDNAIVYYDPRLKFLGKRIILPSEMHLKQSEYLNEINTGSFERHRYRLGIAEGINDFPRGKYLPLEANCDYLNGVSFEKGCYIGQELTARTHHTGVIRKRFMPLCFEEDVILEKNCNITNEHGKNCGKLVIATGKYGLGLLRIVETLNSLSLKIGQHNVSIYKPFWWPPDS